VVAARFGWTIAFSMASVMALCALTVTLFLEEPPRVLAMGEKSEASVGRMIALLLVASMACGVAHFALYVFHQPHIFAQGGKVVRDYFIGFTVGALVMRVVFGGTADRFGHARTAIVSLALYALVTGLAALMTPRTLGVFGLAQGVLHGVFYPALVALGVTRAGHAAKGRTITWLYAVFNLGGMLAGLGVGVIAKHHGTAAAFYVAGMITSLGALALVPSFLAERGEAQRAGTTRTSST
jgi:predicted MFS family arabinose efflux permease